MKFNPALIVSFLPLLVQANPVAVAEAQPAPNSLEQRDKTCWVYAGDGPVACRIGPGRNYPLKDNRRIGAGEHFDVNCQVNWGENIFGNP
jgi:hypothetical protein